MELSLQSVSNMPGAKPNLVFFGTEVADYEKDSPLLHIFMKSGPSLFNEYIDPRKQISKEVQQCNHLTVRRLQLYRDNVFQPSLPLRKVLEALLEYLKKFDGPCILIGHKYCYCDSFRLIRDIKQCSMEKEFASVIAGFTSTYLLLTEKFPEKNDKELIISKLAKDINLAPILRSRKGRCIETDVVLLEQIGLHHFTAEELKVRRSFRREQLKYKKTPKPSLVMANTRNTITSRVPSLVSRKFKRRGKKTQKTTTKKNDDKTKKAEGKKNDIKTVVKSQKMKVRIKKVLRKPKMIADNKKF